MTFGVKWGKAEVHAWFIRLGELVEAEASEDEIWEHWKTVPAGNRLMMKIIMRKLDIMFNEEGSDVGS
jgi:hypothetical protein